MPNKLAGTVLLSLMKQIERSRQAIANSCNYSQIDIIEQPFNIHHSVEFRTPAQISIGHSCCIKARTILNGRSLLKNHGITLGPDTYIKEQCYFDAYDGYIEIKGSSAFAQGTYIHGGGGIVIGENVITGPNCSFIASNHIASSREYPIMLQGDRRKGIRLGCNVWLGANVIVLDGSAIGDNCVIGAGSLITGTIPSNTITYNKRIRHERNLFSNEEDH